jgi:hypothetical protein
MRKLLAILIVLSTFCGCGGGGGDGLPPPRTRAVPPVGTYTSPQNVTLQVYENGYSGGPKTIYYTVDGSTPTTFSTVYVQMIPITKNTTLKFFGSAKGPNDSMLNEPVNTEVYVITP